MHGISGYRMRAFLCSSVCRQGTLELCHKHALLHTPSHNVALNFTLPLPKAIVKGVRVQTHASTAAIGYCAVRGLRPYGTAQYAKGYYCGGVGTVLVQPMCHLGYSWLYGILLYITATMGAGSHNAAHLCGVCSQ